MMKKLDVPYYNHLIPSQNIIGEDLNAKSSNQDNNAKLFHELNNLIQPVINSLDLLSFDENLGPKNSQLVDLGLKSINRMKGFISENQDLMKNRNNFKLEQNVNINKAILDINLGLENIINGHEIQVNLDLEEGLDNISAYSLQLYSILKNLIKNGLHSMYETGGSLNIKTQTKYIGNFNYPGKEGFTPYKFINIKINDMGTGINDEIKNKIFDMYFTTKKGNSKLKGCGLGLVIVKEGIELHKGFLIFDSKVGKGTTFDVFIPDYKYHK